MNSLVLIAWFLVVSSMSAASQSGCCVGYEKDGVCFIHNTKARLECFKEYAKEYKGDCTDKLSECETKLRKNPKCNNDDCGKCKTIGIFAEEREELKNRGNLCFSSISSEKGKESCKKVGLALSGGGIRAHAFHLGLLSGLFKEDKQQRDPCEQNKENENECNRLFKKGNTSLSEEDKQKVKQCEQNEEKKNQCDLILRNKPILERIGYISGVSGGAWAAGHYKTYKDDTGGAEGSDAVVNHDRKFFSKIEKFIKDTGDDCDNNEICLLNSYEEQFNKLKKTSGLTDMLKLHSGFIAHDIWQDMIYKNVLHSKDIKWTEIEADEVFKKRPLLIINATHDASIFHKNFPFEFTSKYIGTIVDLGNVPTDSENYYRRTTDDAGPKPQGVFFYKKTLEDMNLTVDQVLAMSSAASPFTASPLGISWNFPIDDDKFKIENKAREEYKLSDGGFSENLGALPLIERELDWVIISDAVHDPDYKFEDLNVLKHHAKYLLKMQIDVDLDNDKYSTYPIGKDTLYDCETVEKAIGDKLSHYGLNPPVGLIVDRIAQLNDLLDRPNLYETVIARSSMDKAPTLGKNQISDVEWKKMKDRVREMQNEPQIKEMVKMTNSYRGNSYISGSQKFTIQRLNRHILDILLKEQNLTRKTCHPLEPNVELFSSEPIYRNDINIVTGTYYELPLNMDQANNRQIGKIIYIRVHKDIKLSDEFMQYLGAEGYGRLQTYLRYSDVTFPQDKTFTEEYDRKLVKAYYVLGKYVGKKVYETINRMMEENSTKK